MLETEKQLQLAAISSGWQSSSYLCSYIVARFISLLTFFSWKSLHCINWIAKRNLAVVNVEISVFGRIGCIGLEYDRIHRGGSKVPHWWFIDPTHVGPMSQKKFFFIWNFQQSKRYNWHLANVSITTVIIFCA